MSNDYKAYMSEFKGRRRERALERAHDIRKFEIELYWKRGTYFWTFIAVIFAGYFAIPKDQNFISIFIVTCIGFIFSLAWYLVNRGSSSWQRNWEAHVDLLEDEITGPLHKVLINRNSYYLLDLTEPYSFSPSRINNLLAFAVTCLWLLLMLHTLNSEFCWRTLPRESAAGIALLFTSIVAISLLRLGKSRRTSDKFTIEKRVSVVASYNTRSPSSRQ